MLNRVRPHDLRKLLDNILVLTRRVLGWRTKKAREADLTGFPKLTKRELFAAMAMMGSLANSTVNCGYETLAEDAVAYADSLIAQLGGGG